MFRILGIYNFGYGLVHENEEILVLFSGEYFVFCLILDTKFQFIRDQHLFLKSSLSIAEI